jgi:hypothetical protein
MIRILIGVFIVLHGLVHLLYFALSRKYFELEPPLVGWPERSWVLSRRLNASTTRSVASVLYVLATILFVVSGISVLIEAAWATPLLVVASVFSSAIIYLFWDGSRRRMPDKGLIGIPINIALLVVLLILG